MTPRRAGARAGWWTVAVLTGIVSAGAALGGCGVPTDSAVHTIAPEDVPPVFSTSPESETPPPSAGKPEIYFADARGNLIATPYRTEQTTPKDSLQDVLTKLTTGPSRSQAARGLSTAIPPALVLNVNDVAGGKATLALGGDQLPTTDQTRAIAQIVLSATSVPEILSVQLTLNDRTLEAPLLGGALTTRPLTASDYRRLVHPSTTG